MAVGNGRIDRYCWSHGAYNHKSEDFFTRMTGKKIMKPWRTGFPVPQGLVLAVDMEGQRC